MNEDYTKGAAFILEGDTEKEFYLSLLMFLCEKHGVVLEKQVDCSNPDVMYKAVTSKGKFLIKFHVVNTITQMPYSARWFKTQCYDKHESVSDWSVFLCYDTDDYKNDITKFNEGDWAILKNTLKENASRVIDVAAAADIEDVILTDLMGVANFLGGLDDLSIPTGKKGKVKLKKLYQRVKKTYHEGTRARDMINSLDMQYIIDNSIVPLIEIERIIF
jgi:hypothetical protein